MDKALTNLETMQIGRVLEIMELTNSGMSLSTALRQVGLAPGTYYKYLAMAKSVKEELQTAKNRLELIEYADILSAKGQILRRLIDAALDKNTFPSDVLAIYQFLDTKVDVLEERNRPSGSDADFLRGPVLSPGTSTHRDVSIRVDGVEITVSKKPDIVDGELRDI